MYTVSQLIGVSKQNGRGLVIYLSNYIGRATDSGRAFERMLGRLGRDLRKTGVVVVAFAGDDDAVAADVLNKEWDESQRAAIARRPGLLIIDKNFDDFDPTVDNYFHINLRTIYNTDGTLNEKMAEDLLVGLDQVFSDEQDMFYKLNDMKIVARRQRLLSAVNLRPSFYGLGIDVREFARAFMQ
jgi:hypothetical protein